MRKALRAEMQEEKDALDAARAEQAMQEAARLRQHQQQLQEQSVLLAEENEEEPECMAVPTSSSVGTEFASDALWSTPMNVEDSSDTSDSYIEENDPQSSLKDFLQHWALKHQITHSALDDLLVGLKANGHTELPSTARTLLSTPRDIRSTPVSGMEYVHFGLRRAIEAQLNHYPQEVLKKITTLELSLNIDGVPLFKNSKTTLWPVLCAIHLSPTHVFPVTLTSGPAKPNDLEFLNDVVAEMKDLLENGIQGKMVVMRCVVCDAPAKAMVKATKLCTGYYGCDKCAQKGTWEDGRVTYPDVQSTLRTNDLFRREMAVKETEGYTVSPFLQLPIDMIKMFPIDYMHQACLGVMRKLLVEWVRGSRKVRLSTTQLQEVSRRLCGLREYIYQVALPESPGAWKKSTAGKLQSCASLPCIQEK